MQRNFYQKLEYTTYTHTRTGLSRHKFQDVLISANAPQ